MAEQLIGSEALMPLGLQTVCVKHKLKQQLIRQSGEQEDLSKQHNVPQTL